MNPIVSALEGLAWLMENSDGVAGLRADGGIMSWPDVAERYLPQVHEAIEECRQ